MESTRAITDMIVKEAEKSAKHILQDAKKTSENTIKQQKQKGVQKANEVSKILLKKAESEAELNKLNTNVFIFHF